MVVLVGGAVWFGLVLYLLIRILRQFRGYRSAALAPVPDSTALPPVSIIIPVRNEIANIDRCLSGLSAQHGLAAGSSIIVVDDGSCDGTAAAAARRAAGDPRIKLVAAGALPAGWAGKPHACWHGAKLAEAPWLCFVDADVCAGPGLMAAALSAAEVQGLAMLSLHPRQQLESFWERLIIPAGLLALACVKRFEPGSPDVVNGQFLLVCRDAYCRIGSHAAVRGEICEDKALAQRMRAHGLALRVLSAEDLADTRMYRDLGSLWHGFSKNAAEMMGGVGASLAAAAQIFVFASAAVVLPGAGLMLAAATPTPAAIIGAALAIIGSTIVIGIHCGTARHFRVPVAYGLIFALGDIAVAGLACSGVVAQLCGRVTWKGRTYRVTKTSAGSA
jgi:chlorobactene glucosyltransferase